TGTNYSLATTTGTGSTIFGGLVGNTRALLSLATSGDTSVAASVTTTSTQNYGGNLTLLGSNISLNTTDSPVNIVGNVLGSGGNVLTYLNSSTWTTYQNGSQPYTLSINLGQNWTYQADYLVGSMDGGGLNTILSYGSYTDGVLIRTQGRGDSMYLKGNNNGAIDLFGFGNSGTNGAYETVKVTYVNAGSSGTLSVYTNNVLISSMTVAGALNPGNQTLSIGSAIHAPNEGLNATIKNISINLGSADSPLTINSGAGAATIGGNVSNVSTLTINSSSTGSRITGAIGNAANLVNNGAGILTLLGNNTFSGSTTINAGTLNVTGALPDNTAVTVASGATYIVGATDTVGSISGAGHVVLT
ncbi:autotransporter-associated beta strand repeat-containing protein, partial [Polynucleobacter nymphae]|uniref:autotransporter-associated beta strand repeat-containing protein n=1 Tax=Polynucleobacter nymphae TaxID=2081043 RepID=UPI001C0D2476